MKLHLGNKTSSIPFAKAVDLDGPSVVQNVGALGSGRNQFLVEIARQAIQGGAGLIYVGWHSEPGIWASIYTAAEASNRQAECFADVAGNKELAPVSMDAIVNSGAILWCGPSALEVSALEADVWSTEAILDLSRAITARQDRTRSIVLILDGLIGGLQGLPAMLKPLVENVVDLNLTLVVSDRDEFAHLHDDQVAAHATCRVFMYSISEPGNATFHRLLGDTHDLRALQAGEAIVARGPTASQSVERVRLSWPGHSATHTIMRPANSLRPLASS
ncbi:hypothetical protein [Ralstonia sp. ASV6]|uniref:hypothetical protein n=1 Tax=Ralstonia sp. ASV6 TaxID=2795124 RepID=UPI0018ED34F2|nr:hypothetical protein [Ralstonia sp. ASV6]